VKEIADLVQMIGIPALVIVFYIYKDLTQGNKAIETSNKIIQLLEQNTAATTKVVSAVEGVSERMTEMRDAIIQTKAIIDIKMGR